MKFGYAIVYVDDVAKTVEFYERAFGLKRLFVHDSGQYAEMETGATRLAFTSRDLARENGLDFGQLAPSRAPAPFELDLVTDDVEAAFARAAKAGARELKKPARKPWGQTVGYVADPNGTLVALCTPVE